MYNDDPEAIYAVIAMVLASVFLQANVYVTLRMLKGMQFTLVIVLHFFNLKPPGPDLTCDVANSSTLLLKVPHVVSGYTLLWV